MCVFKGDWTMCLDFFLINYGIFVNTIVVHLKGSSQLNELSMIVTKV
jgi:hypothetical protein